MKVTLDRRIYSDSVISKAVYWLSGNYIITRNLLDDNTEELSIEISNNELTEKQVFTSLMQALNDFKLRQIIADETRDVKTILYAKAFAEDENLCEDDIHD